MSCNCRRTVRDSADRGVLWALVVVLSLILVAQAIALLMEPFQHKKPAAKPVAQRVVGRQVRSPK